MDTKFMCIKFEENVCVNQDTLNHIDERGETVLFKACNYGNLEGVRRLIYLDLENRKNEEQNHKLLDPNIPNIFELTPLSVACLFGYQRIVELLIAKFENKLNLNKKDKTGSTAFKYACANKNTELIKSLLGCKRLNLFNMYENDETILHILIKNRDIEIIKCIVESKKSIDFNATDVEGNSPLILACKTKQVEIVKMLIDIPNVNVNQRHKTGQNILHYLCGELYDQYDPEIFQSIIDCERLDINAQDYDGDTALMTACKNESKEAVVLLIKNEMVDTDLSNNAGQTPYDKAIASENKEIITLFFENAKMKMQQKKNK